jgi:hypothetical protein
LGNPLYVSSCLEGLAGVAAAQSRYQQAARLCAARNALMSQIRSTLTPADPVRYAETLAAIEAALGDDGFVAGCTKRPNGLGPPRGHDHKGHGPGAHALLLAHCRPDPLRPIRGERLRRMLEQGSLAQRGHRTPGRG